MELTVRTDTAHPQASIPIYFIHSLARPFCQRPNCWCQTNKAKIAHLLTAIKTGMLELGEAASFADGSAE